jgi:hypothetical protein
MAETVVVGPVAGARDKTTKIAIESNALLGILNRIKLNRT